MDYASMAIAGVAILPLILGLVEFAKKFGLQGNGCVALAMVLGIVFAGLGYAIESGALPEGAMFWVNMGVVGLSVGLASAGLYDLGKRLTKS